MATGGLRASDRDRERTAERLRHAAQEGRLASEELEQRLHAAFSARTYGELDAIVSDLPHPRSPATAGTLPRARLLALVRVRTLVVSLVALVIVVLVLAAAGVTFVARESRAAPNQSPSPAAVSAGHTARTR